MIEFHAAVFADTERLADWVEVQTLTQPPCELAVADVVDAMRNSGAMTDEDVEEGEDEDDAIEVAVADAWSELTDRARNLGDAYPFSVEKDIIRLSGMSWRDVPAFTLLAICDVGGFYQSVDVSFAPGADLPDLFEYVVEAAQAGIFNGASVCFPASGGDGWSKKVAERVEMLADRFDREVGALDDLTDDDSDGGLDVASRLKILDELPGTLIVLTQCASGANWKKKTGEPAPDLWAELIRWKAPLVKALAVPWRLAPGCPGLPRGVRSRRAALSRYSKTHNGAIVLDRPRLISGRPDRALVGGRRTQVTDWCDERVAQFPTF